MVFSGDLEKLQNFIDSFTSYKDSIHEHNSNSAGFIQGFINAIKLGGVSYDEQMQKKLSNYKSKVQELEQNLDGTITELKSLLEKAQNASKNLEEVGNTSTSSFGNTV